MDFTKMKLKELINSEPEKKSPMYPAWLETINDYIYLLINLGDLEGDVFNNTKSINELKTHIHANGKIYKQM